MKVPMSVSVRKMVLRIEPWTDPQVLVEFPGVLGRTVHAQT